jgi:hypothetical protein
MSIFDKPFPYNDPSELLNQRSMESNPLKSPSSFAEDDVELTISGNYTTITVHKKYNNLIMEVVNIIQNPTYFAERTRKYRWNINIARAIRGEPPIEWSDDLPPTDELVTPSDIKLST